MFAVISPYMPSQDAILRELGLAIVSYQAMRKTSLRLDTCVEIF